MASQAASCLVWSVAVGRKPWTTHLGREDRSLNARIVLGCVDLAGEGAKLLMTGMKQEEHQHRGWKIATWHGLPPVPCHAHLMVILFLHADPENT